MYRTLTVLGQRTQAAREREVAVAYRLCRELGNSWEVVDALARIGTPAVPALRVALRGGQQGWAIEALSRMKPGAAAAAVPDLIDLFEWLLTPPGANDDRLSMVRSALIHIGATSALEGAVERPNVLMQHAVVDMLRQLDAAPALIRLLRSTDPDIRERAAWSLGTTRAPRRPTIKALTGVASDPMSSVRAAAAEGLGRAGAEGAETPLAVAALRRLLADRSVEVRASAASALGDIGPRAAPALLELERALADRRPVRERAALALARIVRAGPAASSVVPALVRALRDGYWLVRCQAAVALGSADPEHVVGRFLVSALAHRRPATRREAAWLLGQLRDEAHRPALRRMLRDRSPAVRAEAAAALRLLGVSCFPRAGRIS